jgi:hypothetical protein
MESFITLLGILAAFMVLYGYYSLESGKISSENTKYYMLNGISSIMLIISISYQYDTADSGALLMEICWLIISLKGFLRLTKKKSR